MQAREKKGVVDAKLGVCGVKGLKAASLSIQLGNVAANMNATALMIGGQAADILIEELGSA
jgi:alcohol oxidase